jgi:hypothetical protein
MLVARKPDAEHIEVEGGIRALGRCHPLHGDRVGRADLRACYEGQVG